MAEGPDPSVTVPATSTAGNNNDMLHRTVVFSYTPISLSALLNGAM